MSAADKPDARPPPPQQQQQPQATPSTGRGADSAMAVLRKKRISPPEAHKPAEHPQPGRDNR